MRLNEDQPPGLEVLESALDDSDLVFDASAELGIQYLMSDLAAESKIPFIGISTTFGAWSGSIVRIHPTKTNGCWLCYRSLLKEGKTVPIQGRGQKQNKRVNCFIII